MYSTFLPLVDIPVEYGALTAALPPFADSFESGDTSHWTVTVP